MSLIIPSIYLLLMTIQPTLSANFPNPMSIGTAGNCPSQDTRDEALQNIKASIRNLTLAYSNNIIGMTISNCGPGQWYQVAHLNMSDPSQQCPSAWTEYNTSGVRACRRPDTTTGSCPATFYATSRQYNRVCGRAIGYQIGSPDAFGFATVPQIDTYYVHGVSITHGLPRNHIWTYAAGLSEGDYQLQHDNCPCTKPGDPGNVYAPSFVADNYYCESGNPTDTYIWHNLYREDPLWDGQQCEGECCSNGKSPPWFSVELPNPSTDDIEVRLCSPEDNRDETSVQLLEVYVQ